MVVSIGVNKHHVTTVIYGVITTFQLDFRKGDIHLSGQLEQHISVAGGTNKFRVEVRHILSKFIFGIPFRIQRNQDDLKFFLLSGFEAGLHPGSRSHSRGADIGAVGESKKQQ